MASQENDWIEWTGGKCPVAAHQRVQVRHADGWEDRPFGRLATLWTWEPRKRFGPTNIVAYRVVSA